jgi:hypothetical protein
MYSYPPANQFSLSVTTISPSWPERDAAETFNKLFAFSDDVTVVRGSHQFGFGADVPHWNLIRFGPPAPAARGPSTAA